jgi:hypothetical protein
MVTNGPSAVGCGEHLDGAEMCHVRLGNSIAAAIDAAREEEREIIACVVHGMKLGTHENFILGARYQIEHVYEADIETAIRAYGKKAGA